MKPLRQITEVNGFPLEERWFEAMAIGSEEQSREALHAGWQISSRGTTCSRCHGRGQIRRDKNIGCIKCGGTGVLPK